MRQNIKYRRIQFNPILMLLPDDFNADMI